MASPSLQGSKNKQKGRSVPPQQGNATPPFSELDESTQNLSPLVNLSPGKLHPSLWQRWSPYRWSPNVNSISLGSVIHTLVPSCRPPKLPRPSFFSVNRRRQKVIGTLFGQRNSRVSFAVQVQQGAEPGFLLELAFPTSFLVDEMAAGTVRILLECEKHHLGNNSTGKMPALWDEPVWTIYSNGRHCGLAVSRPYTDEDREIFQSIAAISAGAGVLPAGLLGRNQTGPDVTQISYSGGDNHNCALDVMFVRAKFERLLGENSETLHMASPGGRGSGRTELSIFLLRSNTGI